MRKTLILALALAALLAPGAQAKHGPDDAPLAAGRPVAATSAGFAWGDAGIGAGAMALALGAAGVGVAVTLRHRQPAGA
jgi:hypothetical protein